MESKHYDGKVGVGGAPEVVAKRGEFKGPTDSLFRASLKKNAVRRRWIEYGRVTTLALPASVVVSSFVADKCKMRERTASGGRSG